RMEAAVNGAGWADAAGRLALHGPDGDAGTLGVLTKRARRLAGIKRGEVVVFEINLDAIAPLPSRDNRFDAIANYPQADFDVSMLFDQSTPWQAIASVAAAAGDVVREVVFVDDYRGKGVPEGRKSITLRVRVGMRGKTLRSDEIGAVGDAVRAALRRDLSAEERTA
ncbi:MAG: hypothetical protein M3R55_16845, partial [Acidobacteriota bacterium]|nr:hypothetical protein [Acidobacteriota bacterium]